MNEYEIEKLSAMTTEQIIAFIELLDRFNELDKFKSNLDSVILEPFGLPKGYIAGQLERGLAYGIDPTGRVST